MSSNLSHRWPAQIKFIIGNEACERFSYYGITGILAGYITDAVTAGGLGESKDDATAIIHFFKFANYFMPLFGAWLSDKVIGRYRTILWISMVYCLGNGVLASSGFASDAHARISPLRHRLRDSGKRMGASVSDGRACGGSDHARALDARGYDQCLRIALAAIVRQSFDWS